MRHWIFRIIAAAACLDVADSATDGNLTGGCIAREHYGKGPLTPAAKAFASGTDEEAFFPAQSTKTAAPAVVTGWTYAELRKRYPNARFTMLAGHLGGASPVVEVSVADNAQFKVAFGLDGETLLLSKPGEIPPAAVVTAMETQNPAFRTKSGLRPGMALETAIGLVGPAVLFQQAKKGDALNEVVHFGRSEPRDIYFSRYSFFVTASGGQRLANEVYAGPNGSKGCDVYWTREFRPNGTIKSILIQAPRRAN